MAPRLQFPFLVGRIRARLGDSATELRTWFPFLVGRIRAITPEAREDIAYAVSIPCR